MRHRAHLAALALLAAQGSWACNSNPLGVDQGVPSQDVPEGALHVAISTDGPADLWRDFEGYLLRVYTWDIFNLGLNEELTVALRPGDYRLELWGLPARCSVDGDNPQTVSVSEGYVTEVAFQVDCEVDPR